MSGRREWKLPAMVGLSVAAFLTSASAVAALAAQTGPFMWTGVLGFSKSHDQIAYRTLEHGQTPQALAQARTEIQRTLALSPYDNSARLRLVYVDSLRGGESTREGISKLAESYELVSYDYTVAAWRVKFALEHWESLPPDLRKSVFEEAMAYGRVGSQDANVLNALRSINNPQGRLAAALWLHALNQ